MYVKVVLCLQRGRYLTHLPLVCYAAGNTMLVNPLSLLVSDLTS